MGDFRQETIQQEISTQEATLLKNFRQKTGVVALCITGLQNELEQRLYQSLRHTLGAAGYRLLVFYPLSDFYRELKNDIGEGSIYSLIPYEKLDAVIVLAESVKNRQVRQYLIERAKAAGVPLIAVNQEFDDCTSILFDYKGAIESIVRHVIRDHGCKRVNFMAGNKDNPFSEERLLVYKKVLEEEHLPVEEKRIGYGDFWSLPARAAAEKFLEDDELPEAIICANDSMAIAVCQLLKERNLRVPEDIIVTGLDGIEFERYHTPRLTTARADMDQAADVIVEILNDYKTGRTPKRIYQISNRVTFSQSCGCGDKTQHDSNSLTQHLYDQIYILSSFEEEMSDMVAEVTAATDFDEAVKVLGSCLDKLELENVSIYITDNFTSATIQEENSGVFYERLRPVINKRDGQFKQFSTFETENLCPDLDELMEKKDPVFFIPLHFQDVVLALLVVSLPENFQKFRLLNSLHISLNHTLGILQTKEVLRLALDKMQNMITHDYLTGILNRFGFFVGAGKLIRKGEKAHKHLCIFSVDLNGLKNINDTYGHHEGDFAIKKVAEAMAVCAEKETLCARFGGDEFSICGLADDPASECEAYLARVHAWLNEFNQTKQKPYEISASIGWSSEAATQGMNLDALICKADEQMYEHKVRGRRHRSTKREENTDNIDKENTEKYGKSVSAVPT